MPTKELKIQVACGNHLIGSDSVVFLKSSNGLIPLLGYVAPLEHGGYKVEP
jgi:hypothetical protein